MRFIMMTAFYHVSTHSHPKVAGDSQIVETLLNEFQHTATRRWLGLFTISQTFSNWFQHTATRRWLAS